jgi:protein SCO1
MKSLHARTVKLGSTLAVLIAFSVATLMWIQLTGINRIGGPFTLVDHRGKTVTEQNFLGKPMLVFFGYTFCPDVCPTTLFELSKRLQELGPDADRLNVLFITVDPERDTPEKLGLYLSSFDSHITGLSGTDRNIRAVMSEYRAIGRKVPVSNDDYTMDHTTMVYMMNGKGQFVGAIKYEEQEATARAKIRRLLDMPVCLKGTEELRCSSYGHPVATASLGFAGGS